MQTEILENETTKPTTHGTYVPAETQNHYGEFNLYGPLLEVVLGNSENLHMPKFEELPPEYVDVIQPELKAKLIEWDGRPVKDCDPKFIAELKKETEALIKVLDKPDSDDTYQKVQFRIADIVENDIREKVSRGTKEFSQVFAAEPIWIVGRNVLENTWASDMSWGHLFPVRKIHQKFIDEDKNVLHYSAPVPHPVRDYICEGGDILNLGNGKVLIATGKSSTNKKGAEWAKRMLEADGYEVQVIDLPNTGIHHLFAVMCIAGPNLAIAYEDAFLPDETDNGAELKPELPEIMKNFKVVWVNRKDALATVTCATMLNEKTIMIPAETSDPVVKKLTNDHGLTVKKVPFKHHAILCGGIRCKISVVRRAISSDITEN